MQASGFRVGGDHSAVIRIPFPPRKDMLHHAPAPVQIDSNKLPLEVVDVGVLLAILYEIQRSLEKYCPKQAFQP
eukprot:scaffold3549_cov122-Cylindrotheca_fusiformis.AAC.1